MRYLLQNMSVNFNGLIKYELDFFIVFTVFNYDYYVIKGDNKNENLTHRHRHSQHNVQVQR